MNETRVLIVEDEEYLRDIYYEILSEEGFYVETAQEGNEGLAKVKQGGWDLILMDVILPNIDGIEIIRRVKTNEPPEKPNKKIIFLTNLDKDKEMGQALSLGDGYIIKSQITPDVLMGKIRTYLSAPGQTTQSPQTPLQNQSQTKPNLPQKPENSQEPLN